MDFALNDEQRMIQESVTEMLARTAAIDAVRIAAEKRETLQTAWQALADSGLFGMLVPLASNGCGLTLLDTALVAEICGNFAAPLAFVDQSLAGMLLSGAGLSEASAAANGTLRVALASNDGSGRLDRAALDVTLDHNGLSGQKSKVAFAADAAAFLLQMPSGDFAYVGKNAVTIEPDDDLDLTRPTSTIRVQAVPIRYIKVSEAQRDRFRSAGLILTAADALGAWTSVLDRTVSYMADRSQFGHRLSDFQAVRHTLANLAAELESARSLLWYAAALWDEGGTDALRIALIANAHITALSVAATRQCVVLHGAIGYAWECDIHLWLKRVMGAAQRGGSPRSLRIEAAKMRFRDAQVPRNSV